MYIPPKSQHQQILVDISTLDELKSKHLDLGFVIMGDFNRTGISPICRARAIKQIVDEPTRDDAILDIIITNIGNLYSSPTVCVPVGHSDHNTIYWSPCGLKTVGSANKRTVRPLLKPRMHEFGRWITKHSWDEVLKATSTQNKSDTFYNTINNAMAIHFPTKVVKLHTNDKPWMTSEIKDLIRRRQVTFAQKKHTCGVFSVIKLSDL